MTPNQLNQLGLFLGLISGLLLIPEIFKLIPFDYLEERIDAGLNDLEAKTKFPIKFHPPSWKILFSEEQREKYIEPITAVSGLIFSVIWVGTIMFGLFINSNFFILLGLIPPFYTTVQKIVDFRNNVPGAKRHNIFVVFVFSLLLMIFLSPFSSFFRVVFLILRFFVNSIKKYFSKHMVLQKLLIIFAIVAFIFSNILQLIATFMNND